MISLMVVAVLCLALAIGIGQAAPGQKHAPSPRANVSGRLVTEDSRPLVSGTVVISPRHSIGRDAAASEAVVRPDGSFTFHDVVSGEYVLRARARTQREGISLFATFFVVVQARDVAHVDLVLKPGATLRGKVAVDVRHGRTPPAFDSLRVRAPLPNGSSFGDVRGAEVRPDGTFTLQSVMAGSHVLVVQGLAFPWRVSEARILGQDAAERAFDVEAGQQVDGVLIVLSDVGSGVTGTVRHPPDGSLADVLVVAFPADPLRRVLPLRFVRFARPSPDGAYRIEDLAAGEYRVIATTHATEQDASNPEVLDGWMAASTPVTLAEARVANVTLGVTPGGAPPSLP